MVNYALGKVYKLVNNVNSLIFIGSTISVLSRRRYYHTQRLLPGVKQLYDEIGWDKMQIVLIEDWPCESSEQLKQRERHWYDLLKPDLNRARPLTAEEKKEKASKYGAEYRSDPLNKVKAANYQKSPRGKAKHAPRRSMKVLCCCGCEINSSSKYTHRQSKKHHLLYSRVLADFIFS